MPPFVRFLIAALIELPALILWLLGMHLVFVGTWLFGQQWSAPAALKLNLDWREVALPLAAMTAGYFMFEFGEVLRGKCRLGKKPVHMAKAAALHWAAQIVALIAFFGGVACYHSARRQAQESVLHGGICGIALTVLILCFFISHRWSRHYADHPIGVVREPR